MDEKLNLYWGDMHTNIHHQHMPHLDDTFAAARANLDFFPIAYYPFYYYDMPSGLAVETVGQRDEFLEDWEEVLSAATRYNEPGRFVTFPGYEWHGDRRFFGDHNIFYFSEGPLTAAETFPHLCSHLRRTRGIAIPHHTGYQVGERGKDWHYHDDEISPFAEIYSSHGSSEGCNTPFTLDRNADMGPRVSGGTVQEGLAHGYRLGIIASSDSHSGYPGPWNSGLMGLYAPELTRDALWDAFMKRRVYGVTGDRMALHFSINGCFMGGELRAEPPLDIGGHVVGSHAIDRVELLRDNRVIDTYCHSGRWQVPRGSGRCRLKLRIECGWGLSSRHGVETTPKEWQGRLAIDAGRLLGCEGLFTDFGQSVSKESDRRCSWQLTTRPRPTMGTMAQGLVFEVEAELSDHLHLTVDGEDIIFHVAEALRRSRVIGLLGQARAAIEKLFDLGIGEIENPGDVYWHNAHKVKVHLAVPQAAYEVPFRFRDDSVPSGRHWYYLRVSQLNGQMAWSSPIWVEVP